MRHPNQPKLSVSLITGFLGAGKTTLLQRIVASSDFKAGNSALLINDAGPVNIDAKIFRGKAKEVKAVTGGCVCCVNPEEMRATLLEFATHPDIQQVWIEASGIAETDDILDRLMDHPLPQKVEIKEVIHLIDAENFSGGFFGGLAQKNQVALADRVIVNKIDLVKPAALEKILKELRLWNPHALIQPAVKSDVDLTPHGKNFDKDLDSIRENKKSAHGKWKTQWIPISEPQKLQDLERFLKSLPPEVYRAKGFVQISDQKNKTHFIQKVGPNAEALSWEYEGAVAEHGLVLLGQGNEIENIKWENQRQ